MQPNQILLYVADKAKSSEFYGRILEREANHLSPFFAVIPLDGGWTLAMIQVDGSDVPVTVAGGGELIFPVESREKVDAVAKDWGDQGVEIFSQPAEVRFGYTFVALDPDGNRLRVGYFPQG